MNNVKIQVQDFNKNWFDARTIQKVNDQYIRMQMEEVSRNFPEKRVRAVDERGNLLDLL